MKKICTVLLATITLTGVVMPVAAQAAQPNIISVEMENTELMDKELVYYENTSDMINEVEPFVYVTEDGKFSLKDTVPQDLFEKYQLDQLLEHFDKMNQEVDNNTIIVHEDLTIEEVGGAPLLSTFRAVQGRWTRSWWGYERYYNNSQAITFRNQLSHASGIATGVKGITKKFPPVATLSAITSAYLSQMARRIDANNRGRGVWVGITWVAVFNINPR